MALRRQGVFGEQLATKKSVVIRPSEFDKVGAIIKAQRQYAQTQLLQKYDSEYEVMFGEILSGHYGHDAIQGFFDNAGQGAYAYIKSNVGNDGSAIDAVVASATINGTDTNPTIKGESAYKNVLAYGVYGNRFGYKIINGNRFSTVLTANVLAGDSSAAVSSVAGIKVGDYVRFTSVAGFVHKKITAVNESAKTIEWTGVFHATDTATSAAAVDVRGFKIETYFKNKNGVVVEVESELGDIFCTLEPEVTDYYIDNVFKDSRYVRWTDQANAGANIEDTYPADVSTVTYLTGGTDGTAPTTVAHWSFNHSAFNNDPVRAMINPETTDSDYFDALELYCRNRLKTDFPVVFATGTKSASVATMTTTGQNYQSSTAKLMIYIGKWLTKTDQFSSSTLAPDREIPAVGHVVGNTFYVIKQYGIHEVPAFRDVPLKGVSGVEGTITYDDITRTSLGDAGVNLIEEVTGVGVLLKNFFTVSTAIEYKNGNALFMSNYVRESVKDSVAGEENRPNAFNRLINSKTAIFKFMYNLWKRGSTGRVPEGETFGQFINDDGSASEFADHVEIVADATNNSKDQLIQGNRDYDVFMTVPTPTGSIKIGVGLIIP